MGCFDHTQYVELTMHFRCNLKCEHCMIEGTMDSLQPESMDAFQKVLDHNAATKQWKGLILTGSEVTLRKDLPELARRARQHQFDHVRIQTHGMRLAKMDYCHELVDAGVNEYFVSVCAADAAGFFFFLFGRFFRFFLLLPWLVASPATFTASSASSRSTTAVFWNS